MEKTYNEQLNFDFYGELLSDRQKTALEYYYNDDCTISEIAELMNMTRQGAYDVCKRGKKQMAEFEEKLGLVKRFEKNRHLLSDIVSELERTIQKDEIKKLPEIQNELKVISSKINVLSDEF